MNSTNTKLSLKLKPEVEKIMPWIISAKKSGVPALAQWAKNEHEVALRRACERERLERRAEERRREREWLLEHERRMLELERQEQEAEERESRALWEMLRAHLYVGDDGETEFMPSQSSNKGFRRLLSENIDLCDGNRYGQWGDRRSQSGRGHRSWRNEGRKPRKPWYK